MEGWNVVQGSELRPGMGPVYKAPTGKTIDLDCNKIPAVTGACQKGIHFGSGCYDRIGIWYIPI